MHYSFRMSIGNKKNAGHTLPSQRHSQAPRQQVSGPTHSMGFSLSLSLSLKFGCFLRRDVKRIIQNNLKDRENNTFTKVKNKMNKKAIIIGIF